MMIMTRELRIISTRTTRTPLKLISPANPSRMQTNLSQLKNAEYVLGLRDHSLGHVTAEGAWGMYILNVSNNGSRVNSRWNANYANTK